MTEIYIVLTNTGTLLSRLIKALKNYKYPHVSISLDLKLNEMYSFARINPYNAFIGRFVQESPITGTFKRFKNTKSLILQITVTREQYKSIQEIIKQFHDQKKKYKFNIAGLFLSGVNIKKEHPNKFYCAEFVKYVLDNANCIYGLPEIITPDDFVKLDKAKIIYEGYLRNFKGEIQK